MAAPPTARADGQNAPPPRQKTREGQGFRKRRHSRASPAARRPCPTPPYEQPGGQAASRPWWWGGEPGNNGGNLVGGEERGRGESLGLVCRCRRLRLSLLERFKGSALRAGLNSMVGGAALPTQQRLGAGGARRRRGRRGETSRIMVEPALGTATAGASLHVEADLLRPRYGRKVGRKVRRGSREVARRERQGLGSLEVLRHGSEVVQRCLQ
jgi:hypothetical protein